MQRYSGPELEELLDRVVSELGPAAEIASVNKIRSGGVAGFFCREEYEIVVEPGLAEAGHQGTKSSGARIAAPRAGERAAADADIEDRAASGDQTDVSDGQRVSPTEPAADRTEPVFGGPRPGALDGTDQRFLELLERRLEETSAAESDQAGLPARRPVKPPSQKLPAPPPRTPAAVVPPIVTPSRHHPAVVSGIGSQHRFWAKVSMARQEQASIMPTPSPFLAVLGPLSLTTPVVRRLRADADLGSADVVVLTDRAEIVSEPNWQLVRSGHQLVEVANERADWPTLLVIDVPVDLPQWVAPLQQRLRLAGVGIFRYAIPGDPSVERLRHYRLRSDVPYILDLVSRVDPERVVQLIEEQHPVGSVGGASLTAELLVAMREQVGLGR